MKKTLPHFLTLADAQKSPDMPLQEFTVDWFLNRFGKLHLTLIEDLKNGCNYLAQLGEATVCSVFISKVNSTTLVSSLYDKRVKTIKGETISSEGINSLYPHADFFRTTLRPLKSGGAYIRDAGNAFVFSSDYSKTLQEYNGHCPIKDSELTSLVSVLSLDKETEETVSLLSLQGTFTLAFIVEKTCKGVVPPLTVRVFNRTDTTEKDLKACNNVKEQLALIKDLAKESWHFDYSLKTWKQETLNADNME